MAQLVARLHGMEKVRGSNPLSSTDRVSKIVSETLFLFPLTPFSSFLEDTVVSVSLMVIGSNKFSLVFQKIGSNVRSSN